jgi:hypothetical protein
MNQGRMKKLFIATVVGVILLLIVNIVLYLTKSDLPADYPVLRINPTGMASFVSPTVTAVLPEGLHGMHFDKSELYLSDQKEGSSVTISTATFEIPGYVVIFKEEATNSAERIIGTSQLLSRTNKDITFDLNEHIKTGDKLKASLFKAALYMNTEGNRFISSNNNSPVVNSQGDKLSVEFSVYPASAFPTGYNL